MSTTFTIGQAEAGEWRTALEFAYRRAPGEIRSEQVRHALQLIDAGTIDPAGIWVARKGNAITGVQIAVPLGGAAFLFWLPEADDPAQTDALVEAALHWCRDQGGKLAQAIVAPADAGPAAALLRHGFTRITQLRYLAHDLRNLPREPTTAIRCEPLSDANEALFRQTLERTYEGTLDCPELNGIRTIDEILAGYRSAGHFHPDQWWLIRADEEPAGVVILTELPECTAWDLSYVGVVPEQRRRGIARAAVCRVLTTVADSVSELLVAVDERNQPARQLYADLGFRETALRDVCLHFF